MQKNKTMVQSCFLKSKATNVDKKALWLLIWKQINVKYCDSKRKEKEEIRFYGYYTLCRTMV